jgi:hypothetical protein
MPSLASVSRAAIVGADAAELQGGEGSHSYRMSDRLPDDEERKLTPKRAAGGPVLDHPRLMTCVG